MALTPEQQADIEFQEARDAGRRAHEQQMEATRQANALTLVEAQKTAQLASVQANAQAQVDAQAKQVRLDAIRLAKETLIENARSKPVDAREVSAADVQAFAQTLVTYING